MDFGVAQGADEAAVSGGISQRYQAIRQFSLRLVDGLSDADCSVQSMTDASPAKWHLAHTSWFFENFILAEGVADYQRFHPGYGYLFNSYYNSVGQMHPRDERGLLTRPSLDQIRAYRVHVDGRMAELLAGELDTELLELVELGLQHEQQHQELLLTDIKHLLSHNPLKPVYRPAMESVDSAEVPLEWMDFDEGLVEIGTGAPGFAYDNERPRHRHWLNAYALANRPVSNAEYAAFVADGGYRDPLLWLADGWAWVQSESLSMPLYWRENGAAEFTLAGERAMDPHAPVCHLSYYEADAYARWAGARLPTEAEWEAAAEPTPLDGNFVESGVLHAVPATPGAGLLQMYGDVWEWTSSAYAAYPGFRVADGAVGEYNGKFMCNQYTLRGGSCATSATHIRPSYRNFFYPQARWQFSGLRLARDR